MNKILPRVAILLCMTSTLLYCVDEEQILPPDADAASRLMPLAFAGADVEINLPIHYTNLDGRKSTNTLGKIISYEWTKISGPASFKIPWPMRAMTQVTKLTPGTYKFRLTVTNDKNLKHFDDVEVKVTGELFFGGDMKNVSITSGHLGFKGWDKLKSHPYVKYLHLNNIGNTPYAYQQIVKDPVDGKTNVMFAAVTDDDPKWRGTTRAQTTIAFEENVNLPVYHTSHRMFIHPDVASLANYPNLHNSWFTLHEIWNQRRNDADNPAGSSRWTLYMTKDAGTNQLYLMAEAQRTPGSKQILMWEKRNKTYKIPFGKWFTFDVYFKRGAGTQGQYKITITEDGGPPVVVFDVRNTTIYPGNPNNPVATINPFKLYSGDVVYDWMRGKGKKISAYYDDFKWYRN